MHRLNILLSLSDLDDQEPKRIKTTKPQREGQRDSKRAKTREKDFSNQRRMKRDYDV